MKYFRLLTLLFFLSCNHDGSKTIDYPSFIALATEDQKHGIGLIDEFRNLESLKDPTVIKWFESQDSISDKLLQGTNKNHFFNLIKNFENRQKELIGNYRLKKDNSYFFLKKTEGESKKLFFQTQKGGKKELLLDPENYKKGWIINYFKVSWDLSKIVIALSEKGKDESEAIVFDMESRTILPQILTGLSPSLVGGIQWLPNNSGFYYLKIPHFDYNQPSYLLNTETVLYKLGTSSSKYRTVFSSTENPSLPFKKGDFPIVHILDEDSTYEYAQISSSSEFSNTYYRKIDENIGTSKSWKVLFSESNQIAQFSVDDKYLVYRTSKDASNFKICRTSIAKPNFDKPELIVPENKDEVLKDFVLKDGKIFYTTQKNGVNSKFYVKEGDQNKEIKLPYPSGSSYVVLNGKEILISISGWTTQYSLYKFDYVSMQFEDVSLSRTEYPEFENFQVEEIEVKSHDGEMVPLSLIYRKDMKKNGKNRVMLQTYGAYGASYSPFFGYATLAWVSEGNIWAIPHVRGGSEKGSDWYKGGFKTTKPNSWKDLIACTEYLIENRYTSPKLTVNYGVSAGGIPVGMSIIRRPDLFAVAIMDSPELNTIRLEFQPNGPGNEAEFGSAKDSIEFRGLIEMDSYYQMNEDGKYPSTLIKVGMNDGVVVPWNAGKFIAKLQNNTQTEKPALLSVSFESSHVGDGTFDNYYRTMSDLFSFALWQTGHPDFQPK